MDKVSDENQSYTFTEPTEQVLGKRAAELVIGYISCNQDSGRNYLGGLLITDWRTRPLEFSFVSPVKITLMQRIIHGRTLDESVAVDLVAAKLLQEANKTPDIIFVDSELLLGLQRLTKIPVARISRDEKKAQSDSFGTIRFSTANGANADSDVGSVLSTLEPYFDLVEPFTRMAEAIREALKSIPPTPTK